MHRRVALAGLLLIMAAPAPAAAASVDPGRGEQWALDQIGIDAGRGLGGGAGIVVAVIDSGVDLAHSDLRDRLVEGIDLVDDDTVPQDANGHGTHVAGIVAAVAGNGTGIEGVAPASRVMPVRVLDAEGAGIVDDVVAGVDWAVAHGADIVNLSLGEDTRAILGPQLDDALERAWEAGVIPVLAAGGAASLTPALDGPVPAVVVTATTRDDRQPGYADDIGDAPWGMAAPGGDDPTSDPRAAVLSTYWVDGASDQYAYLAGTSMAAPHVSGALAVLLGVGFAPKDAVDRLLATARDIGEPGPDATFGAGRLDLVAAYDGIDRANETPTADSPATSSAPGPASSASTTAAPGVATTATSLPGSSTTAGTRDESSRGEVARSAGDVGDDDPDKTVPGIAAGAAAAGAAAFAVVTSRRTR